MADSIRIGRRTRRSVRPVPRHPCRRRSRRRFSPASTPPSAIFLDEYLARSAQTDPWLAGPGELCGSFFTRVTPAFPITHPVDEAVSASTSAGRPPGIIAIRNWFRAEFCGTARRQRCRWLRSVAATGRPRRSSRRNRSLFLTTIDRSAGSVTKGVAKSLALAHP